MVRRNLIIAIVILSLILAGSVAFAVSLTIRQTPADPTLQTDPSTTAAPMTESTLPVFVTDPSETEPSQTETTQPVETEPPVESFILSFVGDCTLGTMPDRMEKASSFLGTIGEDYSKPFQYVYDYFGNDDCTFANLEGVFIDGEAEAEEKTFVFRGPTGYANILTAGSVEVVSLANNHTYDFGEVGYKSTKTALEEVGVTYVVRNGTALYTTESGLTIGVYAVYWALNQSDMRSDVEKLRQAGAEVIVAAVHLGNEGSYIVTEDQISVAYALIDCGVDIVWGHHPHVLQRIEEYNGGIIYYSLGNFSFGGNHSPYDYDTAILQQQILRDENGNISLGELTVIPCSVSSQSIRNDFQPVPYEPGSAAYDRVLTKLDGSFAGDDIDLSYRDQFTTPTQPEETETTAPTEESTTAQEDQ